MTVSFELEGLSFTALNAGPVYHFTPAISFFVNCTTQAEVDELWQNSPPAARHNNAAGAP